MSRKKPSKYSTHHYLEHISSAMLSNIDVLQLMIFLEPVHNGNAQCNYIYVDLRGRLWHIIGILVWKWTSAGRKRAFWDENAQLIYSISGIWSCETPFSCWQKEKILSKQTLFKRKQAIILLVYLKVVFFLFSKFLESLGSFFGLILLQIDNLIWYIFFYANSWSVATRQKSYCHWFWGLAAMLCYNNAQKRGAFVFEVILNSFLRLKINIREILLVFWTLLSA